jgi:hypothetical protein
MTHPVSFRKLVHGRNTDLLCVSFQIARAMNIESRSWQLQGSTA